jgi:hypothetical protein
MQEKWQDESMTGRGGRLLRALALLLAAVTMAAAQEAIELRPYPQKLRAEYDLDDPAVPAAMKEVRAPAPIGEVTAWAQDAGGVLWLGSSDGLVRIAEAAQDPWERIQYFAGIRWLPDDLVLRVLPDGAGGAWVRTRSGVSHIEYRRMTLAEKAEAFGQRLRARHVRHGLVAESELATLGDLTTSRAIATPDDTLWTALYAASECFRHAATKAPEALEQARESIDALLFLEEVTGQPGLPARTYIRKGESKPADGVWRPAQDGAIEWRGDTGAEELAGHYFAYAVAYDLLPDEALKTKIAATVQRITDRLIDGGYKLAEPNGRPLRNGRWDVDYLISEEGKPLSPLHALEVLSFLKTAHRLTGEARYESQYRRLASRVGYAEMASRLLELRKQPDSMGELRAMLAFYALLPKEEDDRLRMRYLTALGQWWMNLSRQYSPLPILIHRVVNPEQKLDLRAAVQSLERYPLDLVTWTVKNSHRKDVVMDHARDSRNRPQAQTLLPPDERPVMKLDGNPFVVDGGDHGRLEDDGVSFLLPYWLGRYHRILRGD